MLHIIIKERRCAAQCRVQLKKRCAAQCHTSEPAFRISRRSRSASSALTTAMTRSPPVFVREVKLSGQNTLRQYFLTTVLVFQKNTLRECSLYWCSRKTLFANIFSLLVFQILFLFLNPDPWIQVSESLNSDN